MAGPRPSRSLFKLGLVLSICWLAASAGHFAYQMYEMAETTIRFYRERDQCSQIKRQSDSDECREAVRQMTQKTVGELFLYYMTNFGWRTGLVLIGVWLTPIALIAGVLWIGGGAARRRVTG